MKPWFGLVGILVVLAVTGMLVKSQLKPTASLAPAAAAAGVAITATQGATPTQESEQIQQQVKDKVTAAMQAPRKLDDEK